MVGPTFWYYVWGRIWQKGPSGIKVIIMLSTFEPRHDKTNNVAVRPAKTRISLGIRPVWSVFAVRMKKVGILSYPMSAQRRLWSDWADAQADLSLRWAHTHFVGFVMSRLISKTPKISNIYMHLQFIQTTSNIWYYQSRKCFLQNSVVHMKYVPLPTLPTSFKSRYAILKAYKKRGYVDSCYFLSLYYNIRIKLLRTQKKSWIIIVSMHIEKEYINTALLTSKLN